MNPKNSNFFFPFLPSHRQIGQGKAMAISAVLFFLMFSRYSLRGVALVACSYVCDFGSQMNEVHHTQTHRHTHKHTRKGSGQSGESKPKWDSFEIRGSSEIVVFLPICSSLRLTFLFSFPLFSFLHLSTVHQKREGGEGGKSSITEACIGAT